MRDTTMHQRSHEFHHSDVLHHSDEGGISYPAADGVENGCGRRSFLRQDDGGEAPLMTTLHLLRLYLVADPDQTDGEFFAMIDAALRGGVTAVQLRARNWTDLELFAAAGQIRAMTMAAGALFLVNDRLDIALAVGANGVHLGVDDLPLEAARALAPQGFLIGFSPATNDQIASATAQGADYLGVGPVFSTVSKADAGEPIGLELLRRRVEIAVIPVLGIGGITPETAPAVMATGAAGIAVMGAIARSPNPAAAAAAFVDALRRSN